MKTIEEVMNAFEVAALNAGLMRNTRRTYSRTIEEFARMSEPLTSHTDDDFDSGDFDPYTARL